MAICRIRGLSCFLIFVSDALPAKKLFTCQPFDLRVNEIFSTSILVAGRGFAFNPPLVRLSSQKEFKSRVEARKSVLSTATVIFPLKSGNPNREAVFVVYIFFSCSLLKTKSRALLTIRMSFSSIRYLPVSGL